MTASISAALRAAFAHQSKACTGLGSPFMGRILPLLPDLLDLESALGQRIAGWPEATLGPQADSVPLRLCGALHHLHLTGAAPELSAVYPPHEAPDKDLANALRLVLHTHEQAVLLMMDSPPQTNEVRRAAVLIAAGHWLTARFKQPLVTSEIGASAGLNLNWDFMCLHADGLTLGPTNSPVQLAPEWRGTAPTQCPPYLAEARGVDLRPIDVTDPAQAIRLQSYLWPDQPDRLERTRAAITLFTAPDTEAVLDESDALAWLPSRLDRRAGHCHMIYSTIAWQYLPEAARARGTAMIEAAGQNATEDAPLAWFTMEPDDQKPGDQKPGAALTMRLWPGNETLVFGRVDFHGRWVEWIAPAP